MKAFNYKNVVLYDSIWKNQFENAREVVLSIPADSLLYGFRKKKFGRAEGIPLDGWYKDGGSIFGQVLSALSKMYVITGDLEIKEKAACLVREWFLTVDDDGFALFPREHNDTYLFEKLLTGLLDVWEYLHIEEAVEGARWYADYTVSHMPMNFAKDGLHHKDMLDRYIIEWYTMPEALYRLSRILGRQEYAVFAGKLEYRSYWDRLQEFSGFSYPPRHAYSHVNTLSSAARAYLVKKDPYYLKAAEHGYRYIYENETYTTGGYGPRELLFGKKGYLADSVRSPYDHTRKQDMDAYPEFCEWSSPYDHFEVSCGSWAVYKLTGYLMELTGNSFYGSWEEKLLYNGTGALLPLQPEGNVMYYANYAVNGSFKTFRDNRLRGDYSNFRWQCCTGTYLQNVCEYHNMLYYYDDAGIFINQYLPSALNCMWNGEAVGMAMVSQYPFESDIRIRLKLECQVSMRITLRIPSFAGNHAEVFVNGLKAEKDDSGQAPTAGEWFSVNREWKDGDMITIRNTFRLIIDALDGSDLKSVSYGPLVLANSELSELYGDCENPEEWIRPTERQPGHFETVPGHDKGYDHLKRFFKPYIMYQDMEWYYLYMRISDTRTGRCTDPQKI